MAKAADLPIIDLSSPDFNATAELIRKACIEHGFFYIINHGVDQKLVNEVFEQSKSFFALPVESKMKLERKDYRGYTALYAENSDPSDGDKGDSKENFDIGPLEEMTPLGKLNQWPSEFLPHYRSTVEDYYRAVLNVGKRLVTLMAVALDLNEDYFEQQGALSPPDGYLGLLRYPGEVDPTGEQVLGVKAHTDYGLVTLLVTDGVPGLQMCRDKSAKPQVWENVNHINGAYIVNIGDLMERWTNCLFRSTLHRVVSNGQKRYSAAFHLFANPDCLVECIKSCTDESTPPRYPPIRAGDYLDERFSATY